VVRNYFKKIKLKDSFNPAAKVTVGFGKAVSEITLIMHKQEENAVSPPNSRLPEPSKTRIFNAII